jgi:hypothetical protein
MLRIAAVACCLASGALAARAQPGEDPGAPAAPAPPPRIELRVGETAERDVGIAVGYQCDDPALVRVQMRTKSEQANAFVVTGLAAGVTRCRVGTEPHRPSVVYEIRVLPRREPR